MIIDTIVHKYLKNVSTYPNQLIYHFIEEGNDTKQTLVQSFTKSGSIASHLLYQLKLKKGDRALLLYPPGIDFLDAFWACQLTGIIAVPVPLTMNIKQVQNQLIHIQKDCEASVLLTHNSLVALIEYQKNEHQKGVLPPIILATDTIDDSLLEISEINLPNIEDAAVLQYTSGSVSQPKGVVLSHQNIAANLAIIDRYTNVSKMNNGCGWLPHFHDMGLIGQFLFPALIPGPFHFMSPMSFIQNPASWLQMVSDYQSNIIVAPNFAFELCSKYVDDDIKNNLDLACVEVALTGSEPVQADVLNRFATNFAFCGFDANAFMPCYGMAETTLMVSASPYKTGYQTKLVNTEKLELGIIQQDAESTKKLVSCGKIDESYELKIVDLEKKIETMPFEIGEVWLKGPSLAKGYWNRSTSTFNSYLENGDGPYFKTGDLGFIENNELFITGRIKELIIIRGKNYYPVDIEQTVMKSNKAIRKGCVAAFSEVEHETENLVIVAEIKNNALNPDFEDITATIKRSILSEFGIKPNSVYLVLAKQLPKTTSGKMQRLKTRDYINKEKIEILHCFKEVDKQVNTVAHYTQNFIIETIANLCEMPADQIKVDECIFNFGIESIQLPALIQKIEHKAGKKIKVEQLIAKPTVQGIIEHLYPSSLKIKELVEQSISKPIETKTSVPTPAFVLPNFDILN